MNEKVTMLSEEQRYKNKIEYFNLLKKLNVDLTELMKFLESVRYFDAPCTTTDYKAYAGGLCEYALELYNELIQLANAYCPGKYTEEDCIKVALLKDIYKAELYEAYFKNIKNETTQQWEQILAFRVKEDRVSYGDVNFSSYMIVKHFIDFTDEQIEAICNSVFRERDAFTSDLRNVRRTFKLVTLTGMADIVVYYLN